MLEIAALAILVGLIWLVLWLSKGAGYKDAKIDVLEAEIETTKENIKAAKTIEADINKLDDVAVDKLLKDKWTRK